MSLVSQVGSASRRPTLLGVLAHREFRVVWLADAQSSLGDQLSRIALSVLVFDRSGSALLTAVIYAVTYLPALLSGVLLGGLADRFPHRSTLIRCNLARAALVAAMAVPGMPIAALIGLVFVSTLAAAPFDSANSAMLADLLDGERYTLAASLRTITHQVAQLLGFAAGGLLLTALRPGAGLLVDAASFVLAAVLVRAGVRLRPAPLGTDGPREPYLQALRTGVRAVAGSPQLRVLLGLAWLMGLLVVPEGLAAPYAAAIHSGSIGLGLLLAAGPAGTAVGSALFVTALPEQLRVRSIGVLAALAGVPLTACAVRPALAVSVALWFASGVGAAYLTQLMPQYVVAAPAQRRGQAIGLAASGLLAVQGLGILLGGVLAGAAGPAAAIALAGALATVLAGWLAVRWRAVRPVETSGCGRSTDAERSGVGGDGRA